MKKIFFLLTVVLVLAVSCTATTMPLSEKSDYEAVSEGVSEEIYDNSVVQDEVIIVTQPEKEEVKTHYEYAGYGLDVVLGEGSGYITYPTVLTKEDLASFLSFVQSKYSSYLNGITYSLDGNRINLTYPKSFGEAELAIAQQLFTTAFESYIKNTSTPVVEEQPVVVSTPVAESTITPEEKIPVVEVPVVENIVAERSNTPVIILLIVIALIVLAAVYYFFIFKRKEVN